MVLLIDARSVKSLKQDAIVGLALKEITQREENEVENHLKTI